jgi:RNA polymerase sigma factor (sigma-70 family)
MDAEDLTSEIFERLIQKIHHHEITHFKSWLYSVTKNECFMRLRKKNIQTSELNDDLFGEASDSKDELETKEAQFELLETALEDLKMEQQDCIRLFYIEKKSYDQISEQLHISLNQVKSAIQNGKRNLKIRMNQNNESE